MLLQPPGLPRQDSESLKRVQERWRPLPRDRTHAGSGEGWVESDQLPWPQERRREMGKGLGGVRHLGGKWGAQCRRAGRGDGWSMS